MKCACGHFKRWHVLDGEECVCAMEGCACSKFRPGAYATFRSPKGVVFRVEDCADFVRRNPHLFEPADVVEKKCPSHRPGGPKDRSADYYTRADRGLRAVAEGVNESWKGWVLT